MPAESRGPICYFSGSKVLMKYIITQPWLQNLLEESSWMNPCPETQQPWVAATRPWLFYHQLPSTKSSTVFDVVAHSVSHVWLFATPWTAAHQASLSFTISQSQLKLVSIESVMPSNYPTTLSSVTPFSSCPWSFPASGSFPMNPFFASDGQSIGASALASVLPMNIQGWFPLGLTFLISLWSKGFSRIFSSTVWKQQFFLDQSFFMVQLTSVHDRWKNHSFDCLDLCWQNSAF